MIIYLNNNDNQLLLASLKATGRADGSIIEKEKEKKGLIHFCCCCGVSFAGPSTVFT